MDGEYLYSGNAWFKERLAGIDGFYWRKARRMFLFDHDLSSALNLFKFDYRAIKTEFHTDGITLRCSRNTYLDPDEEREYRSGQAWTDDAKNSIRTLMDRIVTIWEPKYMKSSRISLHKLHPTLTPLPLQYVKDQYGKLLKHQQNLNKKFLYIFTDDTDDDVEDYDVKSAVEKYQACLTPLYYHELWSEIVNDYKNVDTKLEERETAINIQYFHQSVTLDEEEETALIFGTNRVTYGKSLFYFRLKSNVYFFSK
jgi:hypothetical protein